MVLIQGALFNFFTELRDFHVYSSCWKPYRTQKIEFKIDENNKHDQYAITGYTSGENRFLYSAAYSFRNNPANAACN